MPNDQPLLTFPCSFELKVMGTNCDEFISSVTAIVAAQCENFDPEANIKLTPSSKGNYMSMTISIQAKSKQHLDSIYLALNQHPLVKLTL